MRSNMRRRIEKVETMLIRPAQTFTQTLLIGQPAEGADAHAWAEYERAIAQARDANHHIIVLVSVRPRHEALSLRG